MPSAGSTVGRMKVRCLALDPRCGNGGQVPIAGPMVGCKLAEAEGVVTSLSL